MAAQLGSADESSRRRRSAEVQGPCLPAGTTAELSRSVQDVSPGAEASCLSSASAYGPSRTARLLTGISEGMLALEFEAPKSLSKIVLAAHFPSGVRVFPSIFGLPVSSCVLTSFRPYARVCRARITGIAGVREFFDDFLFEALISHPQRLRRSR